MKNNRIKLIITVFCIAFLSATSFFGGYYVKSIQPVQKFELNNEPSSECIYNNISLIDSEHQKCYEYSHPYYFPNCGRNTEKNWLEEIYNDSELLKNVLNKDECNLLKKDQKLWQKSYDNTYETVLKFIYTDEDAYHATYANKALALIARQRTIFLKTIYYFKTGQKEETCTLKSENYKNGTISFDEFLEDNSRYKFNALKSNSNGELIYKNKLLLNENGKPLSTETAQTTSEMKLTAGLKGIVPKTGCDPADTAQNGTFGCFIQDNK